MTTAGAMSILARSMALAALVVAAAAARPPIALAAPAATVTIRGTIADASGTPLPGQVVRVLKTRRLRSVSAPRSTSQEVEEARTRTDAEGRFSIEIQQDNAFPFWYLRFYDPKVFDVVKYVLPADVEISRMVESGGPVEIGAVLKTQRDWPKVKALVDEYGAASSRGQILRSLGLPSSRTTAENGREIWVYDAAGVTYVLQGDTVAETRHQAPTAAPPGDAPVPAERVDNP
jgi:hypothetical protein